MVKYESDNRVGPIDERKVVANGEVYYYKTEVVCTTCAQPGRHMYAKQLLNDRQDVSLECPFCFTNHTTKSILARRLE